MKIKLTITRFTGHWMTKDYTSETTEEFREVSSAAELQTVIVELFGEEDSRIDTTYDRIERGRTAPLGTDELFVAFEIDDAESVLHADMVDTYRKRGVAELPGDLTYLRQGDAVPGFPELTVVRVGTCRDLSNGIEDDEYLNTTVYVR
jgi:hypothetical protein